MYKMFNFTMQGQSICPSGSSSSTSPPKKHKNSFNNNSTSKRWRRRRTWNMGALLTLHPPNTHICHKCPKTFPTSQALGGHQNAHRNDTNTTTNMEEIISKIKNKKQVLDLKKKSRRGKGKKITKHDKGKGKGKGKGIGGGRGLASPLGKGKEKVTTTTLSCEAGTSGGVSGQKDDHLACFVVSEGGGSGGSVVIFGVPFGGGSKPEDGVGSELNLLPGGAELEAFLAEEARDLEGAASATLALFPETSNGNHPDFDLKL